MSLSDDFEEEAEGEYRDAESLKFDPEEEIRKIREESANTEKEGFKFEEEMNNESHGQNETAIAGEATGTKPTTATEAPSAAAASAEAEAAADKNAEAGAAAARAEVEADAVRAEQVKASATAINANKPAVKPSPKKYASQSKHKKVMASRRRSMRSNRHKKSETNEKGATKALNEQHPVEKTARVPGGDDGTTKSKGRKVTVTVTEGGN